MKAFKRNFLFWAFVALSAGSSLALIMGVR
jgi:hypothetical protein